MNITIHNFRHGLVPKRSGMTSLLGLPLLMLILGIILVMTCTIRFPTLVKGKGMVLKSTTQGGFYIIASFSNEDTPGIRTGQTVWLLLKHYPPGTWGRIIGWVQSTIPADSNKGNIIVRLQNGLVTDRNKPIPFESGLGGDVFVVIKDINLLQRIL
jgi:hypothetical protein